MNDTHNALRPVSGQCLLACARIGGAGPMDDFYHYRYGFDYRTYQAHDTLAKLEGFQDMSLDSLLM